MIKTITAQLAGMRKPQDFVVYPRKFGAPVMVQSDRAVGRFDPVTGEGVLNWRGNRSKYFVHLNGGLGAEPYTFPAEFVAACVANAPKSGDMIGPGLYVA